MVIHEASLSYRVVREGESEPLDTPEKIVAYMEGAFDADPTVEWFYVIPLNRKNHPLGRVAVTKGIATATVVHTREVFKPVILAGASALVVVHNHPSCDPSPSRADIDVTRVLREAARHMVFDLLDHVIIAENGSERPYYSFSEAGLL